MPYSHSPMTEILVIDGQKLREARERLGLSMSDVARELTKAGFDISPQAVSQIEKTDSVAAKTLVNLMQLYGITDIAEVTTKEAA